MTATLVEYIETQIIPLACLREIIRNHGKVQLHER